MSDRPDYLLWAAGIVVGDALLWPLLRFLGVGADATVQALLLLDTLIVIAWYAHLTYQLALTSQQQFNLAERTFEAANRPCVVIEWQYVPPPKYEVPAGWTYVAKNIGPGLAVTAVWIEDLAAREPKILHLGAIEAGGTIALPRELVEQLNGEGKNPLDRKRHIVIAEPLSSDLWVVSRNLMEPAGRLSHRIRTVILSEDQRRQIHRETAEEYIHKNWPAIQQDLDRMLNVLEGDHGLEEK